MEPIYAAEAWMTVTKTPMDIVFRMPTYKALTPAQIAHLDDEACTILLNPKLRSLLPQETQERLLREYKIVYESPMKTTTILSTGHPFCSP